MKKNIHELNYKKNKSKFDSLQNIKSEIQDIKISNLRIDPTIIKRRETNFNGTPDVIYWGKNNEPFTGIISENYIGVFDGESYTQNGQCCYQSDSNWNEEYIGPKYEITVVDGYLNGTWKEWFTNGQIQKIENYENGKRSGVQAYFSSSGDTLGYVILMDGNGRLVIHYSKEENNNLGVKVEENFKDGVLNGIKQKWYKNGKIESKENYSLGVLNGEQFYYSYDGNLICHTNLINGNGDLIIDRRLDNETYYVEKHYLNGRLNGNFIIKKGAGPIGSYILEATYNNDVLSGKYFELFPGIMGEKIEVDFKNGFIDGKYIHGNRQGKLTEETYSNGVLNGILLEWFDNGNKKLSTNYINGKREGEAYKYYENGNVESKAVYKNNINIKLMSYYENGSLHCDLNTDQNGLLEGKQTCYFESGQISELWNYCSGIYCGLQQKFYSDGSIYKKGVITNGNGQLVYYNVDQTILKIEKYSKGKLVE